MLINYKKSLLIDHRSTVSIKDQLYHQFEELLSSSKVVNKKTLLSAPELAKLLKLNLADVNDVYNKLEKNNYIGIRKNQTVYVSKYDRILNFFNELVMIKEGIESLGKTPTEDLTDFEIVKLGPKVISDIDNYDDKRFLRHARIFKADDEPYIYLEEFYPIDRFPCLLEAKRSDGGLIYENILRPKHNLLFKKNKRNIKVELLDKKMAKILKVRKGSPAFKIDMVYYDQDNVPMGYGKAVSLPYFYFDYNIKIK